MIVYEKERVPQGMDFMCKAMYYHSHFFNTSERAAEGRVDSTAKWNEARMPSHTPTF